VQGEEQLDSPSDNMARFLDLLDEFDSEDELGDLPSFPISGPQAIRQESSHGPLHWNTKMSAELQQVVDAFCIEEMYSLGFSVTVADPSQPDCPLVACSTGFTELTAIPSKR